MALLPVLLLPGHRSAAQALQRQIWTTDDGLPQNSVHALLQTSDGFLWLATEGGLARFDGLRFRSYRLGEKAGRPSDDVCCLAQAGGVLFAGTATGLARLNGDRFVPVAGLESPVQALVATRDGALLDFYDGGIGLWRAGSVSVVSLPGALALGPDPAGSALAATADALYRWTGTTWLRLRSLPPGTLQVLADTAGRVWLRRPSEIVALSGAQQRHWLLGKDIQGTRLESISLTAEGVVAGTNGSAFVLAWSGGLPVAVPQVGDATVLAALTDREGELWLGSDSSGVSVLRQRSITTVPGLAGESVTSLAQTADGTVWVGTRDSGLRTVRGGIVSTPESSGRLASQFVLAMAAAQGGGVWVGSPEGLDLAGSSAVRHFGVPEGLPDDFVRTLLPEPDGSLWVGTRKGLARLRNGVVERVFTTADGLLSDSIDLLLQTADGVLLVATPNGVGLLRESDGRVIPGSTDMVQDRLITALAGTAHRTVWAGRSDGRLSLDSPEGYLPRIDLPVAHSAIAALVADRAGHLWMRNANGLVRLEQDKLEQCRGGGICMAAAREFGTQDGMPSIDLAGLGQPSALLTATGDLWFATRRGIAVVEPHGGQTGAAAPPVQIETVLVDGAETPFADGLSLRAGQRRLAVQYAGLSLAAPQQVRYRYRLQGFDKDWSDAGGGTVAEYTNLPPGDYLLLIQARSADSTWGSDSAKLAVRVAAPVYRRWWFYLLVAALVAAVVYGLYWLRVRRVQHEFGAVLAERNRIAREIHDTLAQDFVAVSLQLEMTAQLLRLRKIEPAQEQIDATRALVRDGIRDARESIWALRAATAAGTLPAELQKLVSTESRARLRVTGAYRALDTPVQKEVLRIAKEAFGNAVRHAAAASIAVDLLYSEDAVTVRVSDDGAGFVVGEAQTRAGRYGLRGMRERAEAIGAATTLESAPGAGTTVTLRLPT